MKKPIKIKYYLSKLSTGDLFCVFIREKYDSDTGKKQLYYSHNLGPKEKPGAIDISTCDETIEAWLRIMREAGNEVREIKIEEAVLIPEFNFAFQGV